MPFNNTDLSMEHSFILRGVQTRLLRQGQGPRVLFLHGAGGMNGWPEFFQRLAEDHEVWFPEHPGFGLSDEDPAIQTVRDLAAYYVDYIAQAGIGPVHLVGSSFGGWLAAELAVLSPASVASLTLIGPAGLRPRVACAPGAPPPTLEQFTRKLYFDQSIADALLAQPPDETLQRIQARNRAAATRIGGSFHNPALEAALGAVPVPALVVWGEHDQFVPVAQAQEWRQALRDAQAWVLPRCGHLPQLEKPRELAARLKDFLAALPACAA
jgi:pimeloyl-ACP methyl ester carboxylesterase